jgi:hypothetical protein
VLLPGPAAMADYYPVLARAVSRLSENNARTRHELYERARGIVLEELRKRDPEKLAPEQAALEAAVLRLEAEASAQQAAVRAAAAPPQAPARAAPAPQAPPSGPPADAATPAKTAPRYRFGIFRTRRPSKAREKAPEKPAPAQSAQRAGSEKRMPDPGEALGGALNSLSVMLYGTAFLVAVMAVTGVVYVRGLIWVAEGIVTYPVLLVVTGIVFSLLIILSRAMFHSASTWTTFNFLSRLLYSASRRVF